MNRRVYDDLINADIARTSRLSMAVIDRLQNHDENHKGEMIAAVAVTFLALAERFGIPAQDVFTSTKNMIAHQGGHPAFRAVKDYVRNEL